MTFSLIKHASTDSLGPHMVDNDSVYNPSLSPNSDSIIGHDEHAQPLGIDKLFISLLSRLNGLLTCGLIQTYIP